MLGYMLNEFYRDLGGVALRHDFADVYINGEYKGVYGLEEFFEKRAIENSKKREGPIIKIDEITRQLQPFVYYIPVQLGTPRYQGMDNFQVFQEKKTYGNPLLYNYGKYAVDQMNRFLYKDKPSSEVLDLEFFAKLSVLRKVFGAVHGYEFRNSRFYYNPVSAKIEPITDDDVISNVPMDEQSIDTTIFLGDFSYQILEKDEAFRAEYKKQANLLTDDVIEEFISNHKVQIEYFDKTIRRDSEYNHTQDNAKKVQIHGDYKNAIYYVNDLSYLFQRANQLREVVNEYF
jgi:hypothetical protein